MAGENSYSVIIRNGHKHYNSDKNPVMVLENMNMTVKHGTIYGLLGASGCGKTTLLRCIVGRHKLDSGEINVLGKGFDDINSEVLGRWIGYMPQELALYEYFTISEILTYFGWIHQMNWKDIKSERQFLHTLMHLPKEDQLIETLSGGQKRRVSFACALIHDPELLILDEPTVGIDPVLRESIWKHLTQLVTARNKTIILTTHYIEEAKQADTVGLMRNGQLLVEESPTRLLHLYRSQSLEEVFLQFCVKQDNNISSLIFQGSLELQENYNHHSTISNGFELQNTEQILHTQTEEEETSPPDNETNEVDCEAHVTTSFKKHKKKSNSMYTALVLKAFLFFWRHPSLIVFILVLPVLEVTVMCLSIGKLPKVVHLAVVNNEIISSSEYQCSQTEDGCVTTNIGCHFLTYIGDSLFQKDYYATFDEAKGRVVNGEAWSVLHFPENFSEAFVNRFQHFTDEYTLNQSVLEVWNDASSVLVNGILKQRLYEDFERFTSKWLTECGLGKMHGFSSVKFEEPVYGSSSVSFLDTMIPSLIAVLSCFFAYPLASGIYIKEKEDRTWDRNIVSGVSQLQIIVAYFIVNSIVLIIQDVLMYVCFLYMFETTCKDSIGLGMLFMFLLGLTGLSTVLDNIQTQNIIHTSVQNKDTDNEGTAFSLVFSEESTYFQFIMGIVQTTLQIGGVIWPLEAQNIYLRYISYVFPVTLPSESMKNIMLREWTFIDSNTSYGLYVCLVYCVLSWSFIVIKVRST